MERKWKVLIISMLIYQFVLTITMLNLDQYAQWLHFNTRAHEVGNWVFFEGTVPMKSGTAWLMVIALLLIIVNIVTFRKAAKSNLAQQKEV